MIDKELREKIIHIVAKICEEAEGCGDPGGLNCENCECPKQDADEILALIKKAGYVKPKEK